MTESSNPIHPGMILYEQAMQPLGVSRNKLARDIDVPVGRISDIVAGKRGITPDTALRLGKYFGTSAEMWMQFQTDYDLFVSRGSVWPDIAPRVRELQPMDPETMAVAPVTAMDRHAQASHDADRTSESLAQPAAAAEAGPDAPRQVDAPGDAAGDVTGDVTGDVAGESEEKWWLTPFSDSADDAPDDQPAPEIVPLDAVPATAASPDDAAPSAPEDDASGTQQTFEIDVRPAAAASHVVAAGEPADEATGPARPRRRFTIEVVRQDKQALEPNADDLGAPEDLDAAAAASEPLDQDGFTIELTEGELNEGELNEGELDGEAFAGELPGDAFASELDDDASADEAVEEPRHEYYAPVIARTGTDDFASLDPPNSGAPAATGIAGLTPANWSSALESARRDEPAPAPASAIGDHFDVPLPPEFEPEMEGHLPPWPPAEADDPSTALDIPDPEDARKLYEYDD